MEFRKLKASEIECRVSTVSEKGCSLLLYKDARADMNLLDETVEHWQRKHELINGNLFCSVGIYSRDLGEWVWKQDVGTESYTEKEKGQASDSFKRACFNWGIGRELYTAPFIWIGAEKCSIQNKNGKFTTYDKFEVTEIEYTEGNISRLAITNTSRKTEVFTWGVRKEESLMTFAQLKDIRYELERTGIDENTVAQRYHKVDIKFLTQTEAEKALNALRKTNGTTSKE